MPLRPTSDKSALVSTESVDSEASIWRGYLWLSFSQPGDAAVARFVHICEICCRTAKSEDFACATRIAIIATLHDFELKLDYNHTNQAQKESCESGGYRAIRKLSKMALTCQFTAQAACRKIQLRAC